MVINRNPNSADEQTSGSDIRATNTSVGAAIGETVRTTLGPAGMDKMLVDSNGMVLITNNAKTLLGEMNINLDLLPAAKLLKEVAMGQEEAAGDGTTTAVVIAGELLRNAKELFDQGLHPTTVAHGYELAARRADAEITSAGIGVSLDDTELVEEIVRTAIAGTGGAQDERTLASLIARAAMELGKTGDVRWNRLTVKKVNGGIVEDSSLTPGIVIKGDPVHGAMPRLLDPANVVCFNTDLTADRSVVNSESSELEIRNPDDLDRLLDLESETIESKVESIVESGANAVFSDKSIDERAQQKLAEHGILARRRVATSDLEHIAQATGATITDPGIIEPEDVGSAIRIECHKLGTDDVCSIVTEDSKRISLVLRGGTDQVLNEIERAARSGFAAVRSLHQDGRIVPGGGACEMRTSIALREYASGVNAREQLAIEAFADALESVPRSIAENAGLDPIDTLTELRHRHTSGKNTAGIRALERSIDDVTTVNIVDPVIVKQRSIETAVDVVNRIIRIDDVLEAERTDEIE